MAEGELQFDRAELIQASGPLSCALCNGAIAGAFFTVDVHKVCVACRDKLTTDSDTGSPAGRFFGALHWVCSRPPAGR
jgi:hypothetical protein